MPKSSKPRKKRDRKSWSASASDHITKKWYRSNCIAYRDGWDQSHAFNSDGKHQMLNKNLALIVTNTPIEYVLVICAVCVRQDGQKYVKTVELGTNHTMQQNLTDVYYAQVEKMKTNGSINPIHAQAFGWILTTDAGVDSIKVDEIMFQEEPKL